MSRRLLHAIFALSIPLLSIAFPAFGKGPKERIDLRTTHSRTFELPGGAFRTEIHQLPIFYRDGQGVLRPIKAAWTQEESRFTAERNPVAASLDLGGVTLRTPGGSTLLVEASSLRSQVDQLWQDVDETTLVYALRRGGELGSFGVFPGGIRSTQGLDAAGEARWSLAGTDIVMVRPLPGSPGALTLELADGTRLAVAGFLEQEGRWTPSPLSASRLGQKTELVLRSADRLTSISAAVEVISLGSFSDSPVRYLNSGFYNYFVGGAPKAGKHPTPFYQEEIYRFYHEWDTTPIPDNAQISNATWDLWNTRVQGNPVTLQLYQMASRPSGSANFQGVWTDCGDGTLYGSYTFNVGELKTVANNATFNSDLQSRLGSNWMAVGLRNADELNNSSYGEFSSFSTLQVQYTCPCSNPADPTNATATATAAGSIRFTWTDNSANEVDFLVERSTNGGAFVQLGVVGANSTSYTDNSVSSANTYSYRVRAHNCSCYSAYSATAVVPKAPTGLTGVAVGGSQLNLTWVDTSTNESGFRVEHKVDAGAWSEVATVAANVTTYSYSPLASGVDYFRVRAYDPGGYSWYTNEVSEAPPFTVSGCVWSPGIKESNGTYYTCPNNQVMVGRQHSGDENGTTRYDCCTVGNPTPATPTSCAWSAGLKESSNIAFTCTSNKVLVGRQHSGDENGTTRYDCCNLQQNSVLLSVDPNTCVWSAGIKESNGTYYACPSNKVMVGRQHGGDENGTTKYYCCNVL